MIEAEQLNIRENNGTLKAVLSGSAGFSEGDRAKDAPPRLSGLMFYNEEGAEEGGLVYQGRAMQVGQDADVSLTMDQYRQDQDVYLNHTEHKDAKGLSISDGLQINSSPDWTQEKQEFALYRQIGALPESKQKDARLNALRRGEIGTKRLFMASREEQPMANPSTRLASLSRIAWGGTRSSCTWMSIKTSF